MGIVQRKSLSAAKRARHHERMSISIEEKEQDAKEHYQCEKEAIRARRYKGEIPTESVDVSGSPAGDLSTLTSLKPLSLKPASIFSGGKNISCSFHTFNFLVTSNSFPSLSTLVREYSSQKACAAEHSYVTQEESSS